MMQVCVQLEVLCNAYCLKPPALLDMLGYLHRH